MNNEITIALIGFRGTGKTTIAALLGTALKRKVYSTDTLIEQKEKRTISSLVQNNGWKYFRDVESKILREVCSENGIIVDCGGGIVLRKTNRELLKRNSLVVLLEANVETIETRIASDKNRIRLTKKQTLLDEIKSQLLKRKQYYDELADVRFDTTQCSATIILQGIRSYLLQKIPRSVRNVQLTKKC